MTTYNSTLVNSDTNETMTADELGITEEHYAELCAESFEGTAEGHIRVNGIRVYAMHDPMRDLY